MDNTKTWDLIHKERAAMAATLAGLTPAQWAQTSLCGGWTVQVTAGHGLGFQQRDIRGDVSTSILGFEGAAPQWIRLVRTGDTLDGYYSLDGTAWTLMGSYTIALPTPIYVGLSVTSRNPFVTTTATFSNVTVTGSVSSMSAPATSTSHTGP